MEKNLSDVDLLEVGTLENLDHIDLLLAISNTHEVWENMENSTINNC